jgi:Fic family protein
MKIPAPPPDWRSILLDLLSTGKFADIVGRLDDSSHLPWDKLRFKTPPGELTNEEWWTFLRFARTQREREVPLRAKNGAAFTYVLTDKLLRQCMEITERASGRIALPEQITTRGGRDRYLVNSLIEEAITSSQLEGAVTSRREAKDMLCSGRAPINRSERMIVNNYQAMRRIQEIHDQPLTPDLVREIHRIVTEGTLDDPLDAGRIQTPDEVRIAIYGDNDLLLHRPPDAAELRPRLDALCAFANEGNDGRTYVPAPLKAMALHFMLGYDHYFADGNGRTARAIFYWCMLHEGYWLTEYITISRILKRAPAKYATSFLYTEGDSGDLTYFFQYQAEVIVRALNDLETYLAEKASDVRAVKAALRAVPGEFNHRQVALLDLAMREARSTFTMQSHSAAHNVSTETARKDLMDLESRRLLESTRVRRKLVWSPVPDLSEKLTTPVSL